MHVVAIATDAATGTGDTGARGTGARGTGAKRTGARGTGIEGAFIGDIEGSADPSDRVGTRGRPPIHSDDEMLLAALQAFARQGYAATSIRALNAELGLSHATIGQRFGSKADLFRAAMDHGFQEFLTQIDAVGNELLEKIDSPSDLDELQARIEAFLLIAAQWPEMGRLMNQEGLVGSDRLDHIVSLVMPAFAVWMDPLERLRASGQIRPISARGLFFLVAHGAEAPFTLTAFSEVFDEFDGPLDPVAHAHDMARVIIRGITA